MEAGGGGVGEGSVDGDFFFKGKKFLLLDFVIEKLDAVMFKGGFETKDNVGFG